jgi:H+/Cl- antiporter ClcA
MKKWSLPFLLILLGILIATIGFLYDVKKAGIHVPYQDIAPEVLTHANQEAHIALAISLVGICVFLYGSFLLLKSAIVNRKS